MCSPAMRTGYDEFGKYIGIQAWTNYNTDGRNIDAVWLSTAATRPCERDCCHDHGTDPAGSSNEHELLGHDNDPNINPLVLPARFPRWAPT